jgi:hypothetical protein
VSVLVEKNGVTERVPIVDVTRAAQVALYAVSVLFGVAGLMVWIGRRRTSDE